MLRFLAIALLFACAALAQPSRPVAVVELFTSEGCSSCPPADNVLAMLDRNTSVPSKGRPATDVIVLAEHVDYWNDQGWRDPFSSPLFSARQQEYGIALRIGAVYTPQAIVNGEKEVLGSDLRALSRAIAETGKGPRAEVTLGMTAGGTLKIWVGPLPKSANAADVLLAVAENGLYNDVKGGENRGVRLTHTAVVRSLSKLGEISPEKRGEYSAEAKLNLRPEWVRGNVKLVLLVQDRVTRRILGAASTKP